MPFTKLSSSRARRRIGAAIVCVAALALVAPLCAADNPFAAHNAYPWRLYPKDRFEKALDSGLKHIEIDISYDPARKAVVATHDARPTGNEPVLAELLAPLWERWGAAPDDGYTLIIDFKTASPEIVGGVNEMLTAQRRLLSSLPKRGGDFKPGKITVCLTGSGAAHRIYHDLVGDDADLLAFSDDTGCPGSWQADVASYVPQQPVGFVRFITLEKQNFMDAPTARGNEHVSLARLAKLIELADAGGYRVRIYTINPARDRQGGWDTRYWDACVKARTHMIATDAFELARDYWARQQSK